MSLALAQKQSFDQAAAEAFNARVADILNDGAVAVMLSLGHRSGLFDVMAAMPPAESGEIAKRAELSERYVREWLAVMVTGGIVTYEAASRRYALRAEHAASLVRGAALGNLAVYAQAVALAGQSQDLILECFESGEGTRYEDYPCFHSFMEEDSGQTVVAQLFDGILPLAPGLSERLRDGIEVLDAGCGRGRALLALAERFPKSRFLGLDLCADAIAHATAAAVSAGLDNVVFEAVDLSTYAEEGRFDLVTSFDAVHDQRDPQDLLCRIHRALKPGGTHLMQDIGGSAQLENNLDFPMAAFLYTVSCMHCMPVSLGQGGQGLGTMWGWETAEAMERAAGYASVERHVLPHDPMNVWFVSRKT